MRPPPRQHIDFEFHHDLPQDLQPKTLYISIVHRTTAHMCLCGCGQKIVNPLRPHRWTLLYDGINVSLDPSILNVGIPCGSHYFIEDGHLRTLPPATNTQSLDRMRRDGWSGTTGPNPSSLTPPSTSRRLRSWFKSRSVRGK